MTDNLFNLNNPDFWGIMMRFLINLFFLVILIRFVYFRFSRKPKYLFAYFLMGIVIFFVGSMLKTVFMEFGMAIGLFAVFTILRLRTKNFNIKDMAYIFTVIAISAINSFKLGGFPVLGVLIFNVIIILSAYILEVYLAKNKSTTSHSIIYENMEMLKPLNKEALIKDISERSGQDVTKVRIRKVNYKKKLADLDIFYKV
jgi:hypothetical protein